MPRSACTGTEWSCRENHVDMSSRRRQSPPPLHSLHLPPPTPPTLPITTTPPTQPPIPSQPLYPPTHSTHRHVSTHPHNHVVTILSTNSDTAHQIPAARRDRTPPVVWTRSPRPPPLTGTQALPHRRRLPVTLSRPPRRRIDSTASLRNLLQIPPLQIAISAVNFSLTRQIGWRLLHVRTT